MNAPIFRSNNLDNIAFAAHSPALCGIVELLGRDRYATRRERTIIWFEQCPAGGATYWLMQRRVIVQEGVVDRGEQVVQVRTSNTMGVGK